MVIYIDFVALRLWFNNSIEQVEGCDNILIVRVDKQTRILKQRPRQISCTEYKFSNFTHI